MKLAKTKIFYLDYQWMPGLKVGVGVLITKRLEATASNGFSERMNEFWIGLKDNNYYPFKGNRITVDSKSFVSHHPPMTKHFHFARIIVLDTTSNLAPSLWVWDPLHTIWFKFPDPLLHHSFLPISNLLYILDCGHRLKRVVSIPSKFGKARTGMN